MRLLTLGCCRAGEGRQGSLARCRSSVVRGPAVPCPSARSRRGAAVHAACGALLACTPARSLWLHEEAPGTAGRMRPCSLAVRGRGGLMAVHCNAQCGGGMVATLAAPWLFDQAALLQPGHPKEQEQHEPATCQPSVACLSHPPNLARTPPSAGARAHPEAQQQPQRQQAPHPAHPLRPCSRSRRRQAACRGASCRSKGPANWRQVGWHALLPQLLVLKCPPLPPHPSPSPSPPPVADAAPPPLASATLACAVRMIFLHVCRGVWVCTAAFFAGGCLTGTLRSWHSVLLYASAPPKQFEGALPAHARAQAEASSHSPPQISLSVGGVGALALTLSSPLPCSCRQ